MAAAWVRVSAGCLVGTEHGGLLLLLCLAAQGGCGLSGRRRTGGGGGGGGGSPGGAAAGRGRPASGAGLSGLGSWGTTLRLREAGPAGETEGVELTGSRRWRPGGAVRGRLQGNTGAVGRWEGAVATTPRLLP